MKKTGKILYILIFAIAFLLIGTVKSNAGTLELNNLDFNVQINNDGSMNVTETWDIYISSTNTLYKSFETDSSKYSEITNVTVKETTKGQNINFIKNDEWEYHVAKNHYYGTKNEDGDFEIGWGVGLDNSRGTRKYEISYTVKDAITKYEDYAELYWQFVGEDFEISADKITGTIYLPSNVINKENIKVWGHTEDLNGTIYATDLNKIEFELDNFRSGRYVEIRTLFPTELITSSGRTKNKEILQTAIKEETKWADAANARRKFEKNKKTFFTIIITIANLAIILLFAVPKAIKYIKRIKELKAAKYKPTIKLDYYRDLPDENATPAEALLVKKEIYSQFTSTDFGNIFSATMLDLCLKGCIEITNQKDGKDKDNIKIKILNKNIYTLKKDEKIIYDFLNKIMKDKEEITIKQLEKGISENATSIDGIIKDVYKNANNQLITSKTIDGEIKEKYSKNSNNVIWYVLAAIFLCTFTSFILSPAAICIAIDAILCNLVSKQFNVLTQKGVDEKEEWKGLQKYMENFSMLDKREAPEIVVWEKYLVFATVFGVADKVIKQLKIVYPNIDEMTDLNTYTYMNLMINSNLNSTFSKAISSSMSSAYSSGSGSGGGFSGGGGRRWRPEAAVAGR